MASQVCPRVHQAGEPGSALRTMRRVAAGSALLALACAVGVVLSADRGLNELLAKGAAAVARIGKEPAATNPGKTQDLHWGHKYLKKYGLHPHYWHSGCQHEFRDLCNENYYHHHLHPFLQHTDWLDGSERLQAAHEFDEEEETAFQQATKELHNKVLVEREDWNAAMNELHQERNDKYEAYMLKLQAEKNKTQEILSAWKAKRDAEVAQIDADYLEKIGNVSTGRDQYKTWFDEAEALDKERRETFHNMISDMQNAGSSAKDIKGAELAFQRQEALFQQKLRQVQSSFDKDKQEKIALEKQAKTELAKFKMQQSGEKTREVVLERKYQAEEAKERAAAQKTAADIMHERAKADLFKDQAHSYAKELAKEGSSEAQRQKSLEDRIREAKRKEQLHAKEMQEKARAEEAKSEALHHGQGLKYAGHSDDVGLVTSASAEHASQGRTKPVDHAHQGSAKPVSGHNTKEASKKTTQQTAVKKDNVSSAKVEKKAAKPEKMAKAHSDAKATSKATKKEEKAAEEAASRQAAFLKALSQQADAEFQALPSRV